MLVDLWKTAGHVRSHHEGRRKTNKVQKIKRKSQKRKEKKSKSQKREEKNKTPWGFHLVIIDPHSLSKCQREFKLVKALARSSHPV